MDDENELENQSIDIPIWKRYLLSVTEAAQFYHIGEKRLRQIVDIHPNGEFYLLVGNKVLFSVCSLSNLFFRFHTTTLTEACSNELKQHHL